MSFRRAKNQATNKTVYADNRLSKFITSGNYYLDSYMIIPYGTIIQSAAVNIPNGWLVCNGAEILKETYMNLYIAIGYTYGGSGDYFKVPDIRGRTVIGEGQGDNLTNRNLGSTDGEETHTLTSNEMPSHTHI